MFGYPNSGRVRNTDDVRRCGRFGGRGDIGARRLNDRRQEPGAAVWR